MLSPLPIGSPVLCNDNGHVLATETENVDHGRVNFLPGHVGHVIQIASLTCSLYLCFYESLLLIRGQLFHPVFDHPHRVLVWFGLGPAQKKLDYTGRVALA